MFIYITLADDPDLAHLVDLIDMLPSPEVKEFWGEGGLSIGAKFSPCLERIVSAQGTATDVDYLAVRVLKYLGTGNPHTSQEKITKNLTGISGLPAAGHAWVEDATRTAWTLVVRYSLPNWRGPENTRGEGWLERGPRP